MPSVPDGSPSHMVVIVVVVMAPGGPYHAFDAAANGAAPTEPAARALGRTVLAALDNALSRCGDRRRKNDDKPNKASAYGQPGFHL